MRAPLYSERSAQLFGPEAIDDPHPLYARLRARSGLSRVADTGVHLVATWDLIDEVLGRDADFSANLTGVLMRDESGQPTIFELPSNPASRVIATADDPRHAVHRSIAQPRLAARQAAKLEEPIRRWVREALEAWLAAGGGDFVPVAELVPARVVARVLGLPPADVPRFRRWAMMGGDILAGDIDRAGLVSLAVETRAMTEYLGTHLDAARERPRGDADAPLLHALAGAVDEARIGRDEAVGIASIMFGAGGESTAALIGSLVRGLAERPAVAEQLRRGPQRIPRFVEEVARLEPPFKFHYRAVRHACRLGGFELDRGDRLMLLWASANRDATRIEHPDEMRLDRVHPKNHLSFGRGGHFCIGAPTARLEARVVCEEFLSRAGHLALSEASPPVYARSIFVRRLERLEVVAGAAR